MRTGRQQFSFEENSLPIQRLQLQQPVERRERFDPRIGRAEEARLGEQRPGIGEIRGDRAIQDRKFEAISFGRRQDRRCHVFTRHGRLRAHAGSVAALGIAIGRDQYGLADME
jgi:hypothetical protein